MQILFRQTRKNRYTLPVLAHMVEAWDPEGQFSLGVVHSLAEALEALGRGRPTLLGYSFMTPHLEEVAREVKSLREQMGPRDLLVAGGPHATADPEGSLALGFHAVVVGEAEEIFGRLLSRWTGQEGSAGFPPLWRSRTPAPLEDSLPVSRRLNWMAPLEISRGCTHVCGYCFTPRIYPPPVRHRPLESISSYLECSRQMGRSAARFIAPDAFSYRDPTGKRSARESLEAVIRLCEERGVRQVHLGSFPSEVRPDQVQEEFLELVVEHCANRGLVIGAQSGSDRLLEFIRRGHTVRDVEQAVQKVVSAGLLAHVDMIFGLPNETAGDRAESLHLMERLLRLGRTKIHAHMYLPLPNTPLFPLPPAPVESWFLERLAEFQGHGALDGEWEEQAVLQQRILQWRRDGLIRV